MKLGALGAVALVFGTMHVAAALLVGWSIGTPRGVAASLALFGAMWAIVMALFTLQYKFDARLRSALQEWWDRRPGGPNGPQL